MDINTSKKDFKSVSGAAFFSAQEARFSSQNIRVIGRQFEAKMSQTQNLPTPCREGFAFEFLDAMNQQLELGGRYKVEVPSINAKNSPDIQIRTANGNHLIQEQQLKLNSNTADRVSRTGKYGNQEIRTPSGQTNQPRSSNVQESQVSAAEVSKGARNPSQAVKDAQFKAALSEISHAAAAGAITGAVAAGLISGLEHFLAVERGEIELDQAITKVFGNTLEGALIGGISGGAFAAIPAFAPALVPVISSLSIPLIAIGAFELVNQVGQILDRHAFIKRNALLEQVYQQESRFFNHMDAEVMDYLNS